MKLHNRVVLVTGAGKGIGRACALALGHAGADIILGLRDINSSDTPVREIRAMGKDVLPVQMDVSKMERAGWKAKVGLEEGIQRTYQWFLEHQETFKEVKID